MWRSACWYLFISFSLVSYMFNVRNQPLQEPSFLLTSHFLTVCLLSPQLRDRINQSLPFTLLLEVFIQEQICRKQIWAQNKQESLFITKISNSFSGAEKTPDPGESPLQSEQYNRMQPIRNQLKNFDQYFQFQFQVLKGVWGLESVSLLCMFMRLGRGITSENSDHSDAPCNGIFQIRLCIAEFMLLHALVLGLYQGSKLESCINS